MRKSGGKSFQVYRIAGLGGLFAAACLLFSNFARGQEPAANPPLQGYTAAFPAMGSTFQLSVYAADAAEVEAASERLQAEVQRLNAIFSDYDPNSELMRSLTAAAEGQEVQVSDELFAMLQASGQWHRRTDGAFDASVGSLTRLWRRNRRAKSLPIPEQVAEAASHVGWGKIELNEQRQAIRVADPQLRIDFGGIAGGYVVDRCFELLQEMGLEHCLVDFGGDIRCGAAPPGREGWRIEIAGVGPNEPPLRTLELADAAMTTSGDLWQAVVVDGVRRSHIVDPRTGYGVRGPASVTVIGESCLTVDVLATALSVLDREAGERLLREADEPVAALYAWVGEDGQLQTYATPGFPK